MKKTLFEYSSTNSGGSWWLKDEDWKNLEMRGWNVDWAILEKGKKYSFVDDDGRYLGALAKRARKSFPDLSACVKEWESITGQKATDEGCNCCGAPHTFYWGRAVSTAPEDSKEEYGYASGEGLLPYLFPGKKIPSSIREAMGP